MTQLTITPIMNYEVKTKTQKIFDEINYSNIGILYWQQSTLQLITDLSGPLATANEFQIHYWALVVRLKFNDNSVIDIAFPTIIFNYKQEVNTSHIDFDLKDVSAISDALRPIHNAVTNQILRTIQEIFIPSNDYTIEFLSVPLNTMHRHPTGVSSFSGTDLKKDHETDTGIVFPLRTADNTPSFSSIIYNNPVRMVHTEYRTATGSVDSEEGIKYQKGRCVTIIKDRTTLPSNAERYMGKLPEDKSYLLDPTGIMDKGIIATISQIVYTPNTQFVKAENVTRKTYPSTGYGKTNYHFPTSLTKTTSETVYDAETIKLVKDMVDVTLYNQPTLNFMTIGRLREVLHTLETYYYDNGKGVKLEDYSELQKEELLEQITEVQELVVDELSAILDTDNLSEDRFDQDEPSIEYKRKMLISFGAPEADIKNAPDLTIEKWYTELMFLEDY